MGLQMSKKEVLYQRRQMYDNMKIHGLPAVISSIGNKYDETYDFYNDIIDSETSFDDRIETWLTYDEVPNIKTLRSLGWFIETEDFPIIAYIPVLYLKRDGNPASFKPAVDDKVTLVANPIDDNASVREFLIKDFKGNGFPNTIYYTVKLVPYRESEKVEETPEEETEKQEFDIYEQS